MSKELDDFYKKYSAKITEMDDTPLVKVMDGGRFKMLSIEEYEEMTNKLADLEANFAEMKESCVLLEGLRKSEEEKKDIAMKRVSELKQQLAEKEKEFNWLHQKFAKYVEKDQDKISFAVEQLEKVKEFFLEEHRDEEMDTDYIITKDAGEIADYLLDQIKQLKEGK